MSRKLHNFAEIFFFGLRKNCHRLRDVRPAVVIGLLLFLGYEGLTMGLAGCLVWLFKRELVFWKRRATSHECGWIFCKSCGLPLLLIFLVHPFVSGVPSIHSQFIPISPKNGCFKNFEVDEKNQEWEKAAWVKKNTYFFSADSTSPVHLFMFSPFAILSIFPKEKTVIFVPRFSTPISGQAYIPPPWNGAVCNTPPYNEKGSFSTKAAAMEQTSAMGKFREMMDCEISTVDGFTIFLHAWFIFGNSHSIIVVLYLGCHFGDFIHLFYLYNLPSNASYSIFILFPQWTWLLKMAPRSNESKLEHVHNRKNDSEWTNGVSWRSQYWH